MTRKPIALANWKMSMTVAEGLAFAHRFEQVAGDLLDRIDVVVCPPYTALWPLSRELGAGKLQLGAQNVSASTDLARTGEVSAALLAASGCLWVMLGHWEVRRHLGDDDEMVNRKLHLALDGGLRPIILVGEPQEGGGSQKRVLEAQLGATLAGAKGEQVATMALVYEPESAIGAASPSAVEQVASGAEVIRGWLRSRYGDTAAAGARLVYGGSVAPERAAGLLACPEVDGLGATRRGRNPDTFAEVVRRIARARLR